MKTTLKLFVLVIGFLVLGLSGVQAQAYKSAIGLRLGYPLSASYKTYISGTDAIEAFLGYRGFSNYNWISINGAWQRHAPINEVDNLEWYYGAGVGVQFWSFDFDADGTSSVSVSGYLGLQYTFEDAPITLSLDWVPTLFFGNYGDVVSFNTFGGSYGALAVRYVITE